MEPRALSLLDLPDGTIRQIFAMADISGMARFVCPQLMDLFVDCYTVRASEIRNKGTDIVLWAHSEGMFDHASSREVSHTQFITTPELVEWYMQEFHIDHQDAYKLLTTPEILEWAIAGGQGRQFMFVLKLPSEVDFLVAAEHGRLDVVQWGHRNGFNKPQWSSLCDKAADGGQLHVLKWARSVTPPYQWGATTTEHAAMGGHVRVLKWLRENGCPWNACTMDAAIRRGHHAVAAWARDNGCPHFD